MEFIGLAHHGFIPQTGIYAKYPNQHATKISKGFFSNVFLGAGSGL